MAESDKPATPVKAVAATTSNPESPTTARPLDFDDEPQDTTVASDPAGPTIQDEAPPAKPPRPLSPRAQNENTLKEAFPSIDASVIRAVLIASGGNIEPAFNALLAMTDPDAQAEPIPPAKPPRPARGPATSTAQSQLEADELYARQLAEHYSGDSGHRGSNREQRPRGDPYGPRTSSRPDRFDDREYNFFDDDLPVIRDNIKKGFLETQTKVNAWVQNFKKKLDGEEDDDPSHPSLGGRSDSHASRARRSGETSRRSGDRERYDADPQVLGDDFSALELRDSEGGAPQPRSTRPLANPDLFKPTPATPDRRRVSFQDGAEEIRSISRSPDPVKRTGSAGSKQSKWQPLSTVDPSPVAEHDPFSVGDSDDEKETKTKDPSAEDTERLQKATAEAMADDISTGKDSSSAK